jgi:ABC-type bacteriocin/lantibiotic exporter with double-glycine peptidase domain
MKHAIYRFSQLLLIDAWEVTIIGCFAVASGALSLAVPLAAQALINSVSQGLFVQPLLVLSCGVFIGLSLVGVLKALQFSLSERAQERLFARLAFRLTILLQKADTVPFLSDVGTARMNTFFEVVNVQKSWQKILMDIPVAVVEILLSLAFLAFYGSDFLFASLAILGLMILMLLVLGYGGLSTSIKESKSKYALADWLEQIAQNLGATIRMSPADFWLKRTDDRVHKYLDYRNAHFGILLRQQIAFYIGRALIGSLMLGLGGYLVINGKLTAGQVVAVELAVINLLKAAEKFVTSADSVYDLLTGLDKLGHLTDLPELKGGKTLLPKATYGLDVRLRNVTLGYPQGAPVVQNFDLDIQVGERVTILGAEACGKSTLAAALTGQLKPLQGSIELSQIDSSTLCLDSWAQQVSWIRDHDELLDATLEENIQMGRDITAHELRWALQLAGFDSHLQKLSGGWSVPIQRGGRNLSTAQNQRLLLARAIAASPRMIILDRAMDRVGVEELPKLLKQLFDREQWTLINLWPHLEALKLSDRLILLEPGQPAQSGSPQKLAADRDSWLWKKFPYCAAALAEQGVQNA